MLDENGLFPIRKHFQTKRQKKKFSKHVWARGCKLAILKWWEKLELQKLPWIFFSIIGNFRHSFKKIPKLWCSVMRWFLRNGTSNLVDREAIFRLHIGFPHARIAQNRQKYVDLRYSALLLLHRTNSTPDKLNPARADVSLH